MVPKVSPKYKAWWTLVHLVPLGMDESDNDKDGDGEEANQKLEYED